MFRDLSSHSLPIFPPVPLFPGTSESRRDSNLVRVLTTVRDPHVLLEEEHFVTSTSDYLNSRELFVVTIQPSSLGRILFPYGSSHER